MTGPLDEADEEVNCDPDSTLGEDDEEGFDEAADWPEELGLDDGFEDAGETDEDDAEESEDE